MEPIVPVGRGEAVESPRFKPAPACTLHRLLTLSERRIMALSTKPPRPLVGETGRLPKVVPLLVGVPKVSDLPKPKASDPGRSDLVLLTDGGETMDFRRASISGVSPRRNLSSPRSLCTSGRSSCTWPAISGVVLLDSCELCLAMPGSCITRASDGARKSSTWFLR